MDQNLAYGIGNVIAFYQHHHGYGWATIIAVGLIATCVFAFRKIKSQY